MDGKPYQHSSRLAGFVTRQFAQKLISQNEFVSQRGGRLRIAPHLNTDQHDFEYLEEAMRQGILWLNNKNGIQE